MTYHRCGPPDESYTSRASSLRPGSSRCQHEPVGRRVRKRSDLPTGARYEGGTSRDEEGNVGAQFSRQGAELGIREAASPEPIEQAERDRGIGASAAQAAADRDAFHTLDTCTSPAGGGLQEEASGAKDEILVVDGHTLAAQRLVVVQGHPNLIGQADCLEDAPNSCRPSGRLPRISNDRLILA